MNDLGQRLILFELYNESIELDSHLLETFFAILVDLVLNTVTAIKHFRKTDVQSAVIIATWRNVRGRFGQTLRNISSKIDHLQKLVEAQNITQLNRTQARLAYSLSQLTFNTTMESQQTMKNQLRVNTVPCQRNQAFFGRKEILAEIAEYLHA